MRFRLVLSFLVLSLAFLPVMSVAALSVPKAPADIPILDQTNILTNEQKSALAALIAEERAASSNEIGVLVIPSLEGESLEAYSLEVARSWGIGTSENNNGVLLLVALNDRKLRIEVGYGLEGALPDATAAQIIRNEITPYFKLNQYYEGIDAGIKAISAAIRGEYTASSNPDDATIGDLVGLGFFGLFVVPLWLSSIFARSKTWWAGGALGGIVGIVLGFIFGFIITGIASILILTIIGLLFDWAVSKNYRERKASGLKPSWWAGGGSTGSGSSGGFGGFGGGSFGGGGSSGGW